EDDVNCATGKEASSEKDGQLEEGEIIEDDDANVSESVNMDNSAPELTMKRSAHRRSVVYTLMHVLHNGLRQAFGEAVSRDLKTQNAAMLLQSM
uniref:Uncharacterized protein n=1 Tax=Parascaris equorum TaxID=6256 RepID=A0A914RFS0_PAREQ